MVAAVVNGRPVGFTAQSFTSVSLDPPLVAACVARTSQSWVRIRSTGVFCVSILAEHQEGTARLFAAKGADRFRSVGWSRAAGTGSPMIDGSLAFVDCRIVAEHDGGDHLLVLARVVDLDLNEGRGPLLFYRGGYGRFSI